MQDYKFGVSTEIIGDKKVTKLGTGDGKTEVNTILYPEEKKVGLMVSYGVGYGIGITRDYDNSPVEQMVKEPERQTLLIVDFVSVGSVDAFIDQLNDVKEKLKEVLVD